MIIYFSGTGNSAYVAQGLGEALGDKVICANEAIREGMPGEFYSENPYVFVFPVYLSTMAAVFRRFLEQSRFTGNQKAYFIATCAANAGSSGNDGAALCKKKNFIYMGLETVIMPQNYIILFPMTKDPEITRRQNHAQQQVRTIAQTISKQESLQPGCASSAEYRVTQWVEKLYNGVFTTTRGFRATESCISCGLCAKICVMNRIHIKNGKPRWQGNCTHCMACINRCPKGAIEFGILTRGKKRYVCPKFPKDKSSAEI